MHQFQIPRMPKHRHTHGRAGTHGCLIGRSTIDRDRVRTARWLVGWTGEARSKRVATVWSHLAHSSSADASVVTAPATTANQSEAES